MTTAAKKSTRVEPAGQLNGRKPVRSNKPPVMLRNGSRSSRAQLGSKPLSPMRPEIIDHYVREQRQLESEGRWEEANWLNAWLSGAFISEKDWLEGRMPPMREEFLERMGSG
jgi:hypothetical protein